MEIKKQTNKQTNKPTEIVSAICIITSVVMSELSNNLVYSYMVYLRYLGFLPVVSFVIILKYSTNRSYYLI